MKGSGAHLLKSSSKRRRRQVDIAGQNDEDEISAMDMMAKTRRIMELEQQLSAA